GTFDAGISQGWTTDDPVNIVADANNNGSPANPVNSVKMTATTVNKHLFSPKITLTSGKTYNISTYVNIKQLTSGEVGFYIDEYDANGNWISGQYITGARAIGTSTVSFNYTPTSTNVRSASLQVILVGNSGIVAYVDNVAWVQN
ncbi:MAG TPA: carbohydrate binding domain-containing protein, partial [Candidatus Saccharimonadales bacterium]|nr:carbohydrate binding domain-containing protein [Candidatus Saccharimonadales bacterium]